MRLQHLFIHERCSFMNKPPGQWQQDDVLFFLSAVFGRWPSGGAHGLGA